MTLDLFSPPEKLGATFCPVLDTERLLTATQRVLAVLMDGQPHTITELRDVGGASGDRRARQLRSLGLTIDVTRVSGGTWHYQLREMTPAQREKALQCLAQ